MYIYTYIPVYNITCFGRDSLHLLLDAMTMDNRIWNAMKQSPRHLKKETNNSLIRFPLLEFSIDMYLSVRIFAQNFSLSLFWIPGMASCLFFYACVYHGRAKSIVMNKKLTTGHMYIYNIIFFASFF